MSTTLATSTSAGLKIVALTGVGQVPAGIVQSGGSRTWADGSIATSCSAYLNGDGNSTHTYSGATGTGVYRVQLATQTNVYCDMSADGGGWTLVANAVAGQPGNWHTATAGLNPESLATGSGTAKLSDTDIQSLTVTALRLTSPSYGTKRFLKATCRYAHQTPAYSTACGTTYSDLQWGDARTSTEYRGIDGGINDASLQADSMYFATNDNRGYDWFAGSGAPHVYSAGLNYGAPASLQIWAR
jgi:hypothetical protein